MTAHEFALLHAFYVAILEEELGHPVPVPQSVDAALAPSDSAVPDHPLPESCGHWLAVLDLASSPRMLRDYVLAQNPAEATLVALIRFLVGKRRHGETDRDKLDWVLTHLFKKREKESRTPIGWPKAAVQEILHGMEFPALSQCANDLLTELPSLLDEVKYFDRFHQITDSRLIERGRELKNQFGEEFFHPDALAALINYNLLFGKRFYELFQKTAEKVREIAKEPPPADTDQLLRSDYRTTTDAFRRLGELGRKEAAPLPVPPAKKEAVPLPVPPVKRDLPKPSLDQQLKYLGVDPSQEAISLRSRIEDLRVRLRANPTLTSIANPVTPLGLQDWESNAFRAQYPEDEQTFRVEFARAICRAIAIIIRIYEEIPLYHEKRDTEFLWKKHYDSLVYLLSEGRKHKQALLDLAAVSQQRGLIEKIKQLEATAQKLEAGLSRASAIF